MQKPVALILLNWNTPEYTSNCITSLLANSDTSIFDLIIADNGSTDGSLQKLRSQFPELIFLDNQENLGYAEGNNRAITYSIQNGYTYSLVMNNDTETEEDLVGELFKHLQNHPEAAAAQPAIYWLHKKTEIWNGKGCFNKYIGKVYNTKKKKPEAADFSKAKWLTGCCMMVRNEVFKEIGLFNKQFFLYDEDVEFSFRISAAGHEMHYLPHSTLYHEAGASARLSIPEKEGTLNPVIHYYVSRNRIWLLKKYGSPVFYPAMFLYYSPHYLALLAYFIIRGRRKKAKFLFNGLKDGFFTPEKVIWPDLVQNTNSAT